MDNKIVTASIEPIKAENIKFHNVIIPIKPEGVHIPKLENSSPLVVSLDTIKHAKECAEKLIGNMQNLPWTKEAGDLLAMAYTVLHYTKELKYE